MLHAAIKALVEAAVLIGAGAFAKHLGILSSVDAQVHSTMVKNAYRCFPALLYPKWT